MCWKWLVHSISRNFAYKVYETELIMLPSDYFIATNCRLILGPKTTDNGLKLLDDLSINIFYRSQRKTTPTTNTFTSVGI